MNNYIHYDDSYKGINYKTDTIFEFCVSVPVVDCTINNEFGLIIEHDYLNTPEEEAMYKLATEGKAPYCIFVSVKPGYLPLKNNTVKNMRLDDYDLLTNEYANLLIEELIPYAVNKYNLKINCNPDFHMTAGGSSGGISAFTIAWFRNDYFHRVYMSSPSFLSMGRGNEITHLIKKYETKKIKVYEEYSENEPDEYFGSSYAVDIEAERALKFAGYDYKCVYFNGEGHCSRYRDYDAAYTRLEWLWNNYKTQPITINKYSYRVGSVLPLNSTWEIVSSFPKRRRTKRVLSSHKQMIYYGNENDDVIWSHVVGNNSKYIHGMLHTLPTIYPKGAIDLTLDDEDRLYVLTAIGIQCVRSFGLIDAILQLPNNNEEPLKITIKDMKLYLQTNKHIWARPIMHNKKNNKPTPPRHFDYYD